MLVSGLARIPPRLSPHRADLRDRDCERAREHPRHTAIGADSPERFEVVGGHAAAAFLQQHSERDARETQDVWDAIALHTSPHIAEARGGLTRALRLGVLADFGDDTIAGAPDARARLEADYPRRDIEIVLADAVVAQAAAHPEKAPPASWPHDLYAQHLRAPDAEGINPAF
ncbi:MULTISPECIES: hypothetical protein [unclassified Leucobacter]|uniref:hypothetical protein n=1 Tax=unclassified Leucobacter TaxID=2621730 RepID=UPI00069AABA0|nr:hypothetical protein [Leucobacter sp. Ag1]